ncbi:MAG: ArnT family glycosyltransferase [Chthoniobacteraceae bacterium]
MNDQRSVRWLAIGVLASILLLFALRNVPWHLDDYDQAKQAFTSYEMVERGNWWFQHTPTERIATKPPLAGWISAGLYYATGGLSWDLAWRLPVVLSALAITLVLWRAGNTVAGAPIGGAICAGAFGLNLFAPRLATLVRTDMMLTLWIFLCGYLIWKKLREEKPWTTGERWLFALCMLASMLTKGPIAYAFLAPGIAAFAFIERRSGVLRFAWSGWWTWLLPLVVFLVWAGIGIATNREFYEQVVLKEFLGRFTVGEKAVHNNQNVLFYVAHVLHKWLPWSALLVVALCRREVRTYVRRNPALLWLLCWALGGLIFMSLVPSKRYDRIFPVIPPLCLLLVSLVPAFPTGRFGRYRLEQIAAAAFAFALLFSGGYAAYKVATAIQRDHGALARFGRQAKQVIANEPGPAAVVSGKDEGLVMYVGMRGFTDLDDAITAWRAGELDWLILSQRNLDKKAAVLGSYQQRLAVPRLPETSSAYVLLRRQTER